MSDLPVMSLIYIFLLFWFTCWTYFRFTLWFKRHFELYFKIFVQRLSKVTYYIREWIIIIIIIIVIIIIVWIDSVLGLLMFSLFTE